MKSTNLLITITSISLVFTAMVNAGSSDDPFGLKKAREEHHKKAMDEIKPVNDHYRKVLEQKLKKAKKFNHDEDAKAISEELEALKENPAYLLNVVDSSIGVAQFAGTWNIKLDWDAWLIVNIDTNGFVKGINAEANGEKWFPDSESFCNKMMRYDATTEMYIVEWGNFTLSFEMKSNNRMEIQYWDGGHLYPDGRIDNGTAKRVKE